MTFSISPEKEICYVSIYNGNYWLMLHTGTSEMENTGQYWFILDTDTSGSLI